MTPWFLNDFPRLASERSQIARLASETNWLTAAEWVIDGGGLVVNFDVRAHGFDYEMRLEYPALFPSVPAIVRPRKPDSRLSGHQYGPGGPLCLEFRPDNWTPDITGARLIESTFRLLNTENPLGVAQGQEGGVVASAHATTIGQELRTSGHRLRLFVSADASAFLLGRSASERGEASLALRSHGNCAIFLIRSLQLTESRYAGNIPSDYALASSAVNARAITTHLGASEVRNAKTAQVFGSHVSEDDAAADWLVVVSSEGTAHLFLRLDSGELLSSDTVTQAADLAERTPHQYSTLADRRVAIVGAGSLGTKVGVTLARIGVRRFTLVDDDIFLPENIVRSALDWTAVAHHKTSALAEAIERVAPGAEIEERRVRLTGQESSAVIATAVTKIAECDVIIDATASASNFNVVAAAAAMGHKPLVWAEIFGGGKGGVIARSSPESDPPPHVVRLAYMKYCEVNPGPATPSTNYDMSHDGQVLSASDADVSVIAAHVARITADLLVNDQPEHPQPVYLIGLAKWWVFEGPFDTRPLTIPRESWPEPVTHTEEETKVGIAFLAELLEKLQK